MKETEKIIKIPPHLRRANLNPNFMGVKTTHHNFLNGPLIRGVRPLKAPNPFYKTHFNKGREIGNFNFPTHEYTHHFIKGVRRDPAGIKHPVFYDEILPTTEPLRVPGHIRPTSHKSYQFGRKLNMKSIEKNMLRI